MKIRKLVRDAASNAALKGFHDKDIGFAAKLALVHSEVSEALEDFRNTKDDSELTSVWFADGDKPLGIPIELADVVIRIADICGYYGIDLDRAIKVKMEYNKTRKPMHGGKRI